VEALGEDLAEPCEPSLHGQSPQMEEEQEEQEVEGQLARKLGKE
jgi:hypothetical protein